MKSYLKMSDVFGVVGVKVREGNGRHVMCEDTLAANCFCEDSAKYAAHAINSHDDLVGKLDCAESTIYEVERVLSEMQRNGAFGLDDVIAEVECCIKRLSQ